MGDTGDPWSRSDEGGKDQKSNQKENKNNKKTKKPTNKKENQKCSQQKPAALKEPEMKNKETNKKHLQTNQTSPTPKPNKPKTSLSQILACSLLRHQIRTFSQEPSSLQQAGPHAAARACARGALAVGPTPNLTPPGVGREGTRECASLLAQPQPWANRDRHCLGQEAQGPEPPTKWSFPEGKRGRTRTTLHQILSSFIQRMYRVFSVALNRMCVSSTCSLSPAPPPALPNRAGVLL